MTNTTIDQLITRIGRVHRDLVIDRADIIEWTLEAIEESGEYSSFEEVSGLILGVKDRMVKLPANTYRLLSVYTCGRRCSGMEVSMHGSCILVPCNEKEVTVDLIAFRLDDNMEPLIDDTIAKMCMDYCIVKLLTGPWMKGEAKDAAFQYANLEYQRSAQAARASFRNTTQDQMDRWSRMVRSSIVVSRDR